MPELDIRIDPRGAQQGAAVVRRELDSIKSGAGSAVGAVEGSFERLRNKLVSVQGALAGLGLAVAARKIFEVGASAEALSRGLEAATGSASAAREQLRWLTDTADRMGIRLDSSARAFVGLAAAAKGTRIEGRETQRIFAGVSMAATALGLSAETTEGALLALQQMLNNVTIQAEELNQINERIPGIMGMMAAAAGIATEELKKQAAAGKLLATDVLPKLATVLEDRYGQAAIQASRGAVAELNRFHNAARELFVAIARGGALDAMAGALRGITAELQNPAVARGLADMATGIGKLATAVVGLLSHAGGLVSFLDRLGSLEAAAGALVGLKVGGVPGALVGTAVGAAMSSEPAAIRHQIPGVPPGEDIRQFLARRSREGLPLPPDLLAYIRSAGAAEQQLRGAAFPLPQLMPLDVRLGGRIGGMPPGFQVPLRPTPAQVQARLLETTTEEAASASAVAKPQVEDAKTLLGLRIELLRVRGQEIDALELERDAAIKAAEGAQERALTAMIFEARLADARAAQHGQHMANIRDELEAGRALDAELEAQRMAGVNEQAELAQEILEARSRANIEAVKAQAEAWSAADEAHEREALGQAAEWADAWQREARAVNDVWGLVFETFRWRLLNLNNDFRSFGDGLRAFFDDLGRDIARAALGDLVDNLPRIIDWIRGKLGIPRQPGPGETGGPQGPPQPQGAIETWIGRSASAATLLGSLVPGRAGRVIGGAGTGAAIGMQIGGPWGAGIGAVLGGASGLFGGDDRGKDPIRAQIKQWVAGELWPALAEIKRLGFGPGAFGSFTPGGTAFFKGLGFESGVPQQILERMKRMAGELKNTISSALRDAFSQWGQEAAWRSFLRTLREGIADYVTGGFVDAVVRKGVLSQFVAPFFEQTEKLSRQYRKGRIDAGELEAGLTAALTVMLPQLNTLQPTLEMLYDFVRRMESQITGSTGRPVLVPVTIEGVPVSTPQDAARIGEAVGWGIARQLKRAGV